MDERSTRPALLLQTDAQGGSQILANKWPQLAENGSSSNSCVSIPGTKTDSSRLFEVKDPFYWHASFLQGPRDWKKWPGYKVLCVVALCTMATHHHQLAQQKGLTTSFPRGRFVHAVWCTAGSPFRLRKLQYSWNGHQRESTIFNRKIVG